MATKMHNLSSNFHSVPPAAFGARSNEADSAQHAAKASDEQDALPHDQSQTLRDAPAMRRLVTGNHRQSVNSRSNSVQSQTHATRRSSSTVGRTSLSRHSSRSALGGIPKAERSGSLLIMKVTQFDFSDRNRENSLAEQREIDFLFGEEHSAGIDVFQEMNRWSLRFISDELEDEYKSRLVSRLGRSLRIFSWISLFTLALYTISGLFDTAPNRLARVFLGSVSFVILLISSLFGLHRSRLQKFYLQSAGIIFTILCTVTDAFSFLYENDPIPRYHIFVQAISATYLRTLFRHGFPISIMSSLFHCFFAFYIYPFNTGIQTIITYCTTIPIFWYMGYYVEKFDRITLLTEKRIKEMVISLGIERKKTMDVLHNIFPSPIADLLIERGASLMPVYAEDNCTVLLIEIETSYSFLEKSKAPNFIHMLHSTFKTMDRAIKKYRMDKIKSYVSWKSIGFKYLAVGGLLQGSSEQSAMNAYLAATEILNSLIMNKEFRIKVRIHSGPVYGLVIGGNKRSFDIFGTTVKDVYQLMNLSGEPLLCSEQSKNLIGGRCDFNEHDELEGIKVFAPKEGQGSIHSKKYAPIHERMLKTPVLELAEKDLYLIIESVDSDVSSIKDQDLLNKEDDKGFSQDMQVNLVLQRKDRMYMATMTTIGIFVSYWGFGVSEMDVFMQNPIWTNDIVVWIIGLRVGIFGPLLFAMIMGLLAQNRLDFEYKIMILATHQIPKLFLFIYGIFLALKTFMYLESETISVIPPKSDASIFQEPFVWLVLVICTSSMGRRTTFLLSIFWSVWWSLASLFYRKGFWLDSSVTLIRHLIGTVCSTFLLSITASVTKADLLNQEVICRGEFAQNSLKLEREAKKSELVALMVCDKEIYSTLRDKSVQFALFYEELFIISIEILQLDLIDSMSNLRDKTKLLMDIFDMIQNQSESFGLQLLHGVGGVFTIAAGVTKSGNSLQQVVSFGINIHRNISTLPITGTHGVVELKVGIDVGPCVFGVAGKSRFTLDAWGPVCSMSRSLCSTSKPSRTQVSEAMAQKIKRMRDYKCTNEGSGKDKGYYLVEKDKWNMMVEDFDFDGESVESLSENIILEEYTDDS